jgi:hypothetical protein
MAPIFPVMGHTWAMDEALSAQTVIESGGWHPRYARVLLILQLGDEALVLVDGNGDGAEVESEQWFLTDEGWVAGSSGGIGPFDGRSLWSWGWRSGSGYLVGCASPGETVTVEWRREVQQATANDLGIWAAVFPGQPPPRPAAEALGRAPNNEFRHFSTEEWAEMRNDRPRVVES